ncbi:MAG TPA: FAD-binding oxidoreductase [Natronosporangium sp.]
MRTFRPATVDEVAAAMRETAGLAVTIRGAGTKRGWGPPPRASDAVLDMSGLDRIIEHAAGDMVVQVEAGVPLGRLAAAVAEAGQQLAVDIPVYDDGSSLAGGTVGGALAVAVSGPRRLRYGGLRDLLLGVTLVRADGVVAHSGGKVVKNVAGYDLGKLLTGSYGTLAAIATATLRLHPLPAATRYATVTVDTPAAAYERAAAWHASQLLPSAVELDRPAGGPITLAALFEGTADGVAARAAEAAAAVGGEVLAAPPGWFGRWPGTPDDTLLQVTALPATLPELLGAIERAADAAGLPAVVRGSTGLAILQVGLPGEAPPESVTGFLAALRAGLAGGSAVVVHSPVTDLDWWGPVNSGALALMRRVKEQFDPEHRLSPGRFVGGI